MPPPPLFAVPPPRSDDRLLKSLKSLSSRRSRLSWLGRTTAENFSSSSLAFSSSACALELRFPSIVLARRAACASRSLLSYIWLSHESKLSQMNALTCTLQSLSLQVCKCIERDPAQSLTALHKPSRCEQTFHLDPNHSKKKENQVSLN